MLSLVALALVVTAIGAVGLVVEPGDTTSIIVAVVFGLLGAAFLGLAVCLPLMKYTVTRDHLVVTCGPVLRYRIALNDIRRITRADLTISLVSSMRMPGVALFSVRYTDVGLVRMCATRATRGILLIDTGNRRYGITPVDVDGLIQAIRDGGPGA
ncbi:PH domain-containing protein [Longimycelium tulufanense]|uniref:PH domain-containing protein n=1 Tax=Longimycelium tulufanense TaxID=907463 RepID=UPI00166BAF20|nr:PH domain-containing protein [Longimycelium tulufanense]